MAEKKLSVILTLKDEFSKAMSSIGKAAAENAKKISATGAVIGGALAVGIKSSISAYQESERAQRQLESAVIGVSKGSMDQVKAIDSAAQALQKKSGIDGDALKVGAAQLSTFGLQSQSVVDLTKSLADLTVNQAGASAGAADYEASANAISKALNGQFGVLEKSGIRFTEQQQKMIESGTEAQKVAAIQEGLAQNLKETTDTLGGVDLQTALLKTSMGEISESIGAAVIPIFSQLSQTILPIVQKIGEWVQNNPQLVTTILAVVAGIAGLMAVLYPLVTAIGAVGTALKFLMANPVTIFIALIIGAIILLITHWEQVKNVTIAVWNAIKNAVMTAVQAVVAFITGFINGILVAFKAAWEALKTAITATWEAIKLAVTNALAAVGLIITTFVLTVIETFKAAWEALKTAILASWEAIKAGIGAVLEGIKAVIGAFIEAVKSVFTAGWEAVKGIVTTVTGAIRETITGWVNGIVEAFTGFFSSAAQGWNTFWSGLSSVATGFIGGIKGIVDGLLQKISAVINKLIELKEKAKNALGIGGGGGGGKGGGGGGRSATGGNRFAGQRALVGENGPEEVVFGRGANIIPNHRMGGVGGLQINVTVTGNTMMSNDRDIAVAIGDIITQQFRLNNKFA